MAGVTDDWERKTYAEEIAANIKAARTRAGLTQRQLASKMQTLGFNWQHSLVAKLEAGNRPLLASEVLALCLCFGVSMATILGSAEGDRLVGIGKTEVGSITVRRHADGIMSEFSRALIWYGDDHAAVFIFATPGPEGARMHEVDTRILHGVPVGANVMIKGKQAKPKPEKKGSDE
jgi:transcriptional regulator with XRE-family HTH domain